MDETDEKILGLLERNSRATNKEIASKLKVSEGTVRNRIRRLVEKEVVKRFTIERGANGFSALVLLKVDPQTPTDEVIEEIVKHCGARKVRELAGEWDVLAEFFASSAEQFNDAIEKVRSVSGVNATETLVVLKTT